jgi:hypothetical protein
MQVTEIRIVIETRTQGRKHKIEGWRQYGDNGRQTPIHNQEDFADYIIGEKLSEIEDALGIRNPETEA